MIHRVRARKRSTAFTLSLLVIAASAGGAAQVVELPVEVAKGRHELHVSRAGRIRLHIDGLNIVGLLLTVTDSGGLADQRPAHVTISATAEDGDVFRLSATGTLTTRGGAIFDLSEDVTFDAQGAAVSYELTPRTDCAIELLRLAINLPVDRFSGRRVVAVDDVGGTHTWELPSQRGEAILGSGRIVQAGAEFGDGNAVQISEIQGASSTILWDMRGWDLPWYSLHLRLAAGELEAGTACRLSLRLSTPHELRDPALLAKVEEIRKARKAHFLEDLRAEFKGHVLPLAPFDSADADWQGLRADGRGLERVLPYVADVS